MKRIIVALTLLLCAVPAVRCEQITDTLKKAIQTYDAQAFSQTFDQALFEEKELKKISIAFNQALLENTLQVTQDMPGDFNAQDFSQALDKALGEKSIDAQELLTYAKELQDEIDQELDALGESSIDKSACLKGAAATLAGLISAWQALGTMYRTRLLNVPLKAAGVKHSRLDDSLMPRDKLFNVPRLRRYLGPTMLNYSLHFLFAAAGSYGITYGVKQLNKGLNYRTQLQEKRDQLDRIIDLLNQSME